jgi:molybdopterin guanine dinucleotide-containing S/N-oxide reductase-like protein
MPSVRGEAKTRRKVLPAASKSFEQEQTTIKCLGFLGVSGGVPCAVDTKDGKIIRIRPLHFDWKYDAKQFNPWKIKVRGKVLQPAMKSLPSPFSLAYKKRAYSPNRIKYPLIRVDWNPEGERNPQNRGKSLFRRISWNEVAGIIAGELKRVREKYGSAAVLAQVDGHGECKTVHYAHGNSTLLLSRMGGFTQQVRNPDSWEGWYYGSKHVWGDGYRGLMRPLGNTFKDITDNSGMVLFWGCDPETTPWGFSGQSATNLCYFWSQIGIKQVYICPDLNYGAAVHADKWIPVLPNTDVALQLAIIYTWIKEDIYDREYVATHTVGFDRVKAYVMGDEDGIPKTPEWASKKCGVQEWTIKALAREFASKRTSICHYYGGSYVRGPYSHEPARLECVLLGMQGLGKPGVHQCQISFGPGMPRALMPKGFRMKLPENAVFIAPVENRQTTTPTLNNLTTSVLTKQHIPKTLIQEAILNPPISWWGTGALGAPVEDQFVKYEYPIPEKDGGTEIHMIWTDTPCRTTCWNDGNRTVEALRSPKIECIVAQHPWLENDTLFADIILPSNTTLEVEDIVPSSSLGASEFMAICLQRQAMKPIAESKSDFEVVIEIAKKLGLDKEVTEGRTEEEWIKYFFEERYGLSDNISWEEFQEKGYYVCSVAPDWENDPAGLINFYRDPVANPLPTPTGKLEFYSERLAEYFPDDLERPPMPKWIEKGVTHDERISSERARMFPLLLISNHGRWRVHSQCDDISWTRETPTCKVRGWDGYLYEPVWLHPTEAARRGIKDGDIVKIFNERGVVLGGAYVTERIMPGAVYIDHGARVDFIIPGKLDRGGAINLISPTGTISKNCVGQATSGYLVEIEKVTIAQMEEWQNQYPEAFAREYDPDSGLRFNAWVEGGT